MMHTRRIPINVDPADGEALDSWLEALAHRTQTSWGELLTAVGLQPSTVHWIPRWMLNLTPEQSRTLSVATAHDPAVLPAMTLAHFEGRAFASIPAKGRLTTSFPWGPRAGSRYCPRCLAETGGRWSLTWRLGWTFACLKHRCLLADTCPACDTRTRYRPLPSAIIPTPSRCEAPAHNRTRRVDRCDADLTAAQTLAFGDEHHRVLKAQRRINEIIAADIIDTGVYAHAPQQPAEVLADIRAIAIRVLTYATPAELEPVIGADLLDTYRRDHPQLPANSSRSPVRALSHQAPTAASVTAAGAVAALHCLDQEDVQTAGQSLRWLITAMHARNAKTHLTNQPWTGGICGAAQLAAIGPTLKPSDQLRYRTATSWPGPPRRKLVDISRTADRLPTALWHNVALRFAVPGCHLRQIRPALSVAVLQVDAKTSLMPLTRSIGSPITEHGVSRVLQILSKHPDWPDISRGIHTLADQLAESDVPIDYSRRRRLDYSTLLPDDTWLRICRETGATSRGPARAAVARYYLQERVSGGHVDDDAITPALRTKIADFPYYLTPELAEALDAHAQAFLATKSVLGEPVHYQPSTDFLDGLQLPGPNPDHVDIDALHRGIRAGLSLGHAAEAAGTDLETARYLLTCSPTPQATVDLNAYRRVKTSYPREAFIERYEICRMSLAEIATEAGVSRHTIARLAADYDIETRKPGRSTKYAVDADWLYTQYVDHQRPLPDLARERGVSTTTMARWAKAYGVPLRPRGGARNGVKVAT